MTKIGLIQFILLFLISAAYGQKVKYKDIFALLSTKQFELAEPFLKQYLKENTDNPNAYLFMGNIFQEKASRNDVLKQTAIAIANMDSAIFFYDKAYKTLDDREVRRNKEYYQHYNRRDLRTGEFGVKFSDIQFDIEKRIEGLKDRIDKVKTASHYFFLAGSAYRRSNELFVFLQQKFPAVQQLYLRADDETVRDLTTLSLRFDSCRKALEHYRTAVSSLGKSGYNQEISFVEIKDFRTGGRDDADFFQEQVKLWDYQKFADESRTVIEKEIFPTRQHLVTYDMEINKLREKLNTDSVSVSNDLTKLIDRLLYDHLKKFDSEPLPTALFAMKTTDLEYRSALMEHLPLRDSADLHLQIALLEKEIRLLKDLDSIAAKLPADKLAEKSLDYADFIKNTYSSASVLKSYIRSLSDFGQRELRKKTSMMARYTRALNYIVDGADSIPLCDCDLRAYRPLVTTPEEFTVGLSMLDTTQLQGYFYTITPSRRIEVKAVFPVDKSAFRVRDISAARALVYSDPAGQTYYVLVYSGKRVKEKFAATLAKIDRPDGLAWKVDYPLAFTPSELMVSADTGDLLIKDGTQLVVVDKNGEVR